jgi:ech hydrogenase subunit A
MSPILQNTVVGYMVALVGGITFLLASFIAVSQSHSKKVLAYSTIANLGLIIACAGVGSPETVWAGIFLIIFHAVAKSLLFLSVGTAEHQLHSKDIEDMDNLMLKMPRVTVMLVIGISGMFIAPFGMLISKWAALQAFIRVNPVMSPILILLLSFGSAVTVFFWGKWLGKIIGFANNKDPNLEANVGKDEWASKYIHAFLTVGIAIIFPVVSMMLVEPYVKLFYTGALRLDQSNFIIMGVMIGLILFLPVMMILLMRDKMKSATIYMGGRNVNDKLEFEGSAGIMHKLQFRNYYLEKYFGERNLLLTGILICSVVIAVMFVIMIVGL